MPLEHAQPGTPGFSKNVEAEVTAGKDPKQAVAIAYSMARGDAEEPQVKIVPGGKDKVTGKPARNVVISYGGRQEVIVRSCDPRWTDQDAKAYVEKNYASKLKAARSIARGDASMPNLLAKADTMFQRADAASNQEIFKKRDNDQLDALIKQWKEVGTISKWGREMATSLAKQLNRTGDLPRADAAAMDGMKIFNSLEAAQAFAREQDRLLKGKYQIRSFKNPNPNNPKQYFVEMENTGL